MLVRVLRFGSGVHGKNSKDIVTNSTTKRKIDLPAIRYCFSKIIRVVPNSDEENKFSEKH